MIAPGWKNIELPPGTASSAAREGVERGAGLQPDRRDRSHHADRLLQQGGREDDHRCRIVELGDRRSHPDEGGVEDRPGGHVHERRMVVDLALRVGPHRHVVAEVEPGPVGERLRRHELVAGHRSPAADEPGLGEPVAGHHRHLVGAVDAGREEGDGVQLADDRQGGTAPVPGRPFGWTSIVSTSPPTEAE